MAFIAGKRFQLSSAMDCVLCNAEYLKINGLATTPRLANMISPDLARRYHVLPIAEEGDQITVAMAEPENEEAREAIFAALGKSAYIVRVELDTIEKLIAELWPEILDKPSHLLACLPEDPLMPQLRPYAQAVADLLGAHLSQYETTQTGRAVINSLVDITKHLNTEMVIFWGEYIQPGLKKLVIGSPEYKMMNCLSVSLLIARWPRWPIQKLLLVIRLEESDEVATKWAVRLARSSKALVTVLPITVPIPGMYAHLRPSLTSLLDTDCIVGRKLRWVSRYLEKWEIEGVFHLREEVPDWRIRNEVKEGDYDLIVIAAEPSNRIRRWMNGDLIAPLLSWLDRPLLITK